MRRLHAKLMSILRSRRGFTLLEVLLGMTISTILLICIAGVLPSLEISYINTIELSYSRIMASNVADALKNQIAFAYNVEVKNNELIYYSEYGPTDPANPTKQLPITIKLNEPNPTIPGLVYSEAASQPPSAEPQAGGGYYLAQNVQVDVAAGTVAPGQRYRDFTVTVTVTNTQGVNRDPYVLTRNVRQYHSK